MTWHPQRMRMTQLQVELGTGQEVAATSEDKTLSLRVPPMFCCFLGKGRGGNASHWQPLSLFNASIFSSLTC